MYERAQSQAAGSELPLSTTISMNRHLLSTLASESETWKVERRGGEGERAGSGGGGLLYALVTDLQVHGE
jgi:hypothetical protein